MRFPFLAKPTAPAPKSASREAFLIAALAAAGVGETDIATALQSNKTDFLKSDTTAEEMGSISACVASFRTAGIKFLGLNAPAVATALGTVGKLFGLEASAILSDPAALVSKIEANSTEITALREALKSSGFDAAAIVKDPKAFEAKLEEKISARAATLIAAKGLPAPVPGVTQPVGEKKLKGMAAVAAAIEAQISGN